MIFFNSSFKIIIKLINIRKLLDDNFEIKVISQYENTEVMKNKIEQLQKEYGINLVEESGQKKYEYGNCLIWCDETKKEIVYELRESNN